METPSTTPKTQTEAEKNDSVNFYQLEQFMKNNNVPIKDILEYTQEYVEKREKTEIILIRIKRTKALIQYAKEMSKILEDELEIEFKYFCPKCSDELVDCYIFNDYYLECEICDKTFEYNKRLGNRLLKIIRSDY